MESSNREISVFLLNIYMYMYLTVIFFCQKNGHLAFRILVIQSIHWIINYRLNWVSVKDLAYYSPYYDRSTEMERELFCCLLYHTCTYTLIRIIHVHVHVTTSSLVHIHNRFLHVHVTIYPKLQHIHEGHARDLCWFPTLSSTCTCSKNSIQYIYNYAYMYVHVYVC